MSGNREARTRSDDTIDPVLSAARGRPATEDRPQLESSFVNPRGSMSYTPPSGSTQLELHVLSRDASVQEIQQQHLPQWKFNTDSQKKTMFSKTSARSAPRLASTRTVTTTTTTRAGSVEAHAGGMSSRSSRSRRSPVRSGSRPRLVQQIQALAGVVPVPQPPQPPPMQAAKQHMESVVQTLLDPGKIRPGPGSARAPPSKPGSALVPPGMSAVSGVATVPPPHVAMNFWQKHAPVNTVRRRETSPSFERLTSPSFERLQVPTPGMPLPPPRDTSPYLPTPPMSIRRSDSSFVNVS